MYYRNHYLTLAIPPWSTQKEIVTAYRERLKVCHPDVLGNEVELANNLTTRINLAYEIVKDPKKRSSYDQTIKNQIEKEYIPNPAVVLNFKMDALYKRLFEIKKSTLGNHHDGFAIEPDTQWDFLYSKIRSIYLGKNLVCSTEQRLKAVHTIDLAYNWQKSYQDQSYEGITVRDETDYDCEWSQFWREYPLMRLLNRELITSLFGAQALIGVGEFDLFGLTFNFYEDPTIHIHIGDTGSATAYSDLQKRVGNFWESPSWNIQIDIYTSQRDVAEDIAQASNMHLIEECSKINSNWSNLCLYTHVKKGDVSTPVNLLEKILKSFGMQDGDIIYLGCL